jgi:hypothetical protein
MKMTEATGTVPVPTPENPFRDVKYIAEATGYKAFTIRDWLQKGKLKGYKDQDKDEWKILHSDFVEFCQQKWGSR